MNCCATRFSNKMKIILIFVFAITIIKVSKGSELIKAAVTVANSAFEKHITLIVWERYDDRLITDFLKLYRGSVNTIKINDDFDINMNNDYNTDVLYKHTLIFATEPAEFKYFIQMINRVIVVPIQVILVIVNDEVSANLFSEFTKIAWENDVSDIVLLGYDANGNVSQKTYIPYEDGLCNNYIPVNLDPKTENFFKQKFRNFNGCPIRVSLLENIPYVKFIKKNDTVIDFNGTDGDLLKLIIDSVNATIDKVSSEDHGVMSSCINGTRVGSFNNLVYNHADIMVPSIIIVPIRYNISQISYVYYTVRVVWCMANRREIYDWLKAILPFVNVYTPIIILAMLIIIIIIKLVIRYGKIKGEYDKENTLKLIGIFLGQPVYINSKYRIIVILLIFWIWFSLIVRILYQGSLINGLQKTILEPPTKTLAEATHVADEIAGMPTFIELYKNTSIENRYKQIKLREIPNYLKEIAAGKNTLFAVDAIQLRYYRYKLQMLPERVTSVPACIHMRARWPAAPEISRLIGRIVESGLFINILRRSKNDWIRRKKEVKKLFVPLTLKTLSSCFYGLIIMYCVSFSVFCIEIISNRCKKEKRSKRVIQFKI